MNIDEDRFSCAYYESVTNNYNKRERQEALQEPLVHFFRRMVLDPEPLVDDVEEQTREVREVSFKRGRDEDEKVDDFTELKKCNHTITQEDTGRNIFRKRTREQEQPTDLSLEELINEQEDGPVIEEIPEFYPADAFKSNQLALQTLTRDICSKNDFTFACANGDLSFIKQYIIKNSLLLIELNHGIISTDFRINPLLEGFNTAILNNKSHVVNFFLKLSAVRKNLHLIDNMPLRTAFLENRLTVIYNLLQVPTVLRAINGNFIKSNVTNSARAGYLLQFIMLACLPHAEKAFTELGYNYETRSIFHLITQGTARFPKLADAWKEFLETDFVQISDDGPVIMIETSQVLALLKQEIPLLQNDDDMPDLSKLSID